VSVGNPVPDDCVPMLYPGDNLPPKQPPSNPDAVVVDWDAARAEFKATGATGP